MSVTVTVSLTEKTPKKTSLSTKQQLLKTTPKNTFVVLVILKLLSSMSFKVRKDWKQPM